MIAYSISRISDPSGSMHFRSRGDRLVSIVESMSVSPERAISLFADSLDSFGLPNLCDLLVVVFRVFMGAGEGMRR